MGTGELSERDGFSRAQHPKVGDSPEGNLCKSVTVSHVGYLGVRVKPKL